MDWQAILADWLDKGWVRDALPALGLALLAVLAWWGDRRRINRSNPDAVGWVPWRDIAFWASVLAIVALVVAVQHWVRS